MLFALGKRETGSWPGDIERTLQEFPDSGIAKAALRLIGSAAKYLILLPALMLTSLEGRTQTNDVANGPCIEVVDTQLRC